MNGANTKNYTLFLAVIQSKLDKFFEDQKEYIKCHEGCSLCCRHAEFPFTEVEFDFVLEGFFKLDKKLQMEIMEKVEEIIQEKKKFKKENLDKPFLHDCPFLVDNKCSVYFNRGLICRTFGLLSYEEDGKKYNVKIPFCASRGLNYSSVFDTEKRKISVEKYEKLGNKTPPKEFYMSYKKLIDKTFEKGFNFKFGEVKPLIDWFENA